MEEGRTELEFDEFEKLLGEIPNATSGKPHSEESGPKRVSLSGSLSTIGLNSCKGPSCEKHHNNRSLDEAKISVNKFRQSPTKRVQPEEMNLPDDQSLTSAFAGLSFTNGMPVEAGSPLAKSKSLQNHKILFNGKYINSLMKPNSNVDSQMMVAPSFQSPRMVPCDFDEFGETKVGQESSNLLKQQAGYCQSIEKFSTSVPFGHAVPDFQFLSNVPVHGVQYPVVPDQQQFFLDAQPPLRYLHSQQINQPQISWRNVEEEQYYRMHQQYLYLQQLHSQRFEAQQPIQAHGNVTTRMMSENPRQPYFEVPISHQLEKSRQESFWNNYTNYRGSNHLNPALSFTDLNAMQVLDKVSKQKFPEKILTRSYGVNTPRAVKLSSIGGNESLAHVNQNGKVLSNHHLWHSLSTPTAGCCQLDSLSSWGLTPETTDFKGTDLKPLPPKYNSIDEVTGRIYLLAKDQHGCRFLQRKFSEGTTKDVEKIFLEIIDYIVELMTDPFGNYLVQKLLEVCDEDQRMQMLYAITRNSGELVRISCDMHGTRAVQKVIETLKTPEQFCMVVSALNPGIVTLMKNMNGNHVAQRCLQYLTPEYREFLFEAATTNCVDLATDRHGCCVLQKCLSHSAGEQRHRLVSEITSNALILSQDQFGNYVVQFVFELQLPWATEDILDQLEGNFGDLSMQKCSSNVVEKCLTYAGEEHCTRVIQELIDNPRLDQIMQDPYGNYVIQAALNQSKGALHIALVAAIRPHVPVLRTSPYGKKVLSCSSLKK
ncbi:pumilio homolog 12 [Fagus crenata]